MEKTTQASPLLDTNENYWSLSCILGFLGIPGMILGNQLAQTYGVLFAVTSIFIGNLILWVVGMGIVSMTQGKSHAIDNIKKHFGKISSFLAISLFILAFLMWYTFQLSSTVSRTCQVFQFHEDWKVGLVLGGIVAAISLGGFKALKWACLVGLPILVGISLYYIASSKSPIQYVSNPHFSLFAVLSIIMACLAGTVNFPTFFRHSRSKTDAIIALALIMLFHAFLQVSTIFYGIDILSINVVEAKQQHMISNLVLSTSFLLISFFCTNLINVYFISACWEKLFPRDCGTKKYVICAVMGTIAYIYLEMTNTMERISLIANAITYSMAILVLSLLINFVITICVKHRARYLHRFEGSMFWIVGCIVAIRSLVLAPERANEAFISGVIATVLFAVITVFIEETIWSIKAVINQKCQ